MCEFKLVNIGGADCEPVAGLAAEVQVAPIQDFETVGQPPLNMETYESPADLVTVTAAHTFPVGKGFTTIKGVEETGALATTMIGEKGRRLFQNSLTIQVAGSKAELLGTLRIFKNMRGIFLFTEAGSGNLRQLGSKLSPAWFEGIESAIEAAMEGNNSVTFTINDKQKWPAPIYPSTLDVTMKPAPAPEEP